MCEIVATTEKENYETVIFSFLTCHEDVPYGSECLAERTVCANSIVENRSKNPFNSVFYCWYSNATAASRQQYILFNLIRNVWVPSTVRDDK